MLEHVACGMVENCTVTHRRTGARAVLTLTMESAGAGADFDVKEELGALYDACTRDGWHYLQVRGDWFRYQVVYNRSNTYADLPTWRLEAPFHDFMIRFRVDEPHPLRGRKPDAAGKGAGRP